MKNIKPILACVTLLAFLSYIAAITFIPHSADIGLVNIAVGWLGGASTTVISYYFGSSSGSEKKTEMLGGVKKGERD